MNHFLKHKKSLKISFQTFFVKIIALYPTRRILEFSILKNHEYVNKN